MNLITLKSLQSRIREATGADRELDAFIAAAFLGGEAYHMPAGYEGFRWVRRDPVDNAVFGPAPYTSDPDGLGACVALQRSVLPKAYFEISRTALRPGMIPGSSPFAYWSECGDWGTPCRGEHDSMVHAALLAIVSALIAEEEAKEKADAT